MFVVGYEWGWTAFGSLTGGEASYSASQGGGPYEDPAGFGGQWGYSTDAETGLVLLGHRYYDPGTGRFITRDPAGYGGGVNLYGFAGDNPVNEQDPDGLNPLTDWWNSVTAPDNSHGTSFGSERELQGDAYRAALDDPAHVQYMDAYSKLRAANRASSLAYQQRQYSSGQAAMAVVPGPAEEAAVSEEGMVLYHYTTGEAAASILKEEKLNPSLVGGKDAMDRGNT